MTAQRGSPVTPARSDRFIRILALNFRAAAAAGLYNVGQSGGYPLQRHPYTCISIMSSSKTTQIAAVCHGAVDLRIVGHSAGKEGKEEADDAGRTPYTDSARWRGCRPCWSHWTVRI